jgi:hypothetical protein
MTGLTTIPKEVRLKGLRVLRNWKMLEDKLPDLTCPFINTIL